MKIIFLRLAFQDQESSMVRVRLRGQHTIVANSYASEIMAYHNNTSRDDMLAGLNLYISGHLALSVLDKFKMLA